MTRRGDSTRRNHDAASLNGWGDGDFLPDGSLAAGSGSSEPSQAHRDIMMVLLRLEISESKSRYSDPEFHEHTTNLKKPELSAWYKRRDASHWATPRYAGVEPGQAEDRDKPEPEDDSEESETSPAAPAGRD